MLPVRSRSAAHRPRHPAGARLRMVTADPAEVRGVDVSCQIDLETVRVTPRKSPAGAPRAVAEPIEVDGVANIRLAHQPGSRESRTSLPAMPCAPSR